jgi:single-stranded-DNA-specific exonuclease
MAGGIRIRRSDVQAFAAAMQQYAAANIRPEQLRPGLRIDAQTTLAALGCAVVEHLSRLAPFGQGNPPPVVAIRGCRLVVPPRRMGRTGQTVSLVLAQNDTTLRAVGFNMGDLADSLVGINTVDVAAEPVLNTFNGMTSVELKLRDVVWGT